MINELVQNLIAINNSTEGQEVSFMNALSIAKLYDGMPEPNNLIDEAEEMAASDIDALEKSVMKLKECIYSLKSGPVSHSKMGHPRERTKLIK